MEERECQEVIHPSQMEGERCYLPHTHRLTHLGVELLLRAGVAVTAAVSLLTVGGVSPFIIQLHIGTRSRSEGEGEGGREREGERERERERERARSTLFCEDVGRFTRTTPSAQRQTYTHTHTDI